MRPKAALASILPISLLLAGCSAQDPASGVGDPSASPSPAAMPAIEIPWALTECRFAVGIVSVKQAALAPYLPKGFRSLSPQELADPRAAHPTDDANFGIEAFVCKEGATLNGTSAPLMYGSYFTAVEPPAAMKKSGVRFHFIKWDTLVPDEPRRTLLQSYGVPARDGKATMSGFSAQGPLVQVAASISFNGTETSTISGSFFAPDAGGSFIEYTPLSGGGFANWTTSFAFVSGGVGPATVKAAANSLASKVMGTSEVAGAGFGGVINFKDGKIELPETAAGG